MTTGNAPGAAAADIGANGTGMDAETCSAAHAVPASTLHLVRPNPANAVPVAMDGVKDTRMEILVGRQHGAPNFAMRHYVVAPGGHTPHHAHNYEHEVIIIDGEADVTYGTATHRIRSGDVLFIAPNQMHQFRNVGAVPLRFLCMVPTSFDCGKPTPGS